MTDPNLNSPSLIGKAKELEVASILIGSGLYVFFPLVDAGFDLIATNRKGTAFVPVQVKFRAKDPALNLLPKDVANFTGTNVVVAWIIGSDEKTRKWFVPFGEWRERAKTPPDRKDGLAYVTISEHAEWLSQFEGQAGIARAFSDLFE